MWRRWFLLGIAALFAQTAHADTPAFDLPVECVLGETCYIQKFVDTLPAKGRMADFACGSLVSDGHKGTDIALLDIAQLDAGVTVRAAAAGVVRGVRSDMPDQIVTDENRAQIKGRECGNGLVIEHGNGWITQYCHLREGSLRVRKGEQVTRGQALGLIGLSGSTEFPHLHFSVRKNEKPIDPFDPNESATCRAAESTLWADSPEYVAGGLLSVGFADVVPAFDQIKAGTAHAPTLAQDAGALVFWAYMFGTKRNDTLSISISGPEGFTFSNRTRIERTQALAFRAAGKRLRAAGWPTGVYRGTASLERKGKPISQKSIVLQIK